MTRNSARATRRFSRWLRQKLLHSVTPDGYTSINESAPQDIFIVGYPKSGNTWFQELIAGTVFGVLPEVAPLSLVQDLVPDVHAVPWYKRHTRMMFFKSHEMPNPHYRRVIYLMRDGRDAMVSFLHHEQALKRRSLNFLDFIRLDRQTFPCKWHEHVEAWLANPFNAEMMLVRYEDLKADPLKELRRVCEFAGVERPTQMLKLAVQSASFERMQAKEKNDGPATDRWPKDKLFRRRGEVGSYREEMPREVLEAFMQESAHMLRQCGYC